MIFRILLYAFLIYLLYKIIFEFLIPVYKTTKQVRKGFHEMHSRMNEYVKNQQQNNTAQNNSGQNTHSPKPPHDYIDFEEIK
ncbi:MAG TPA: hypothetical protein VET23_00460 [Chitinophagaceae bacterium]|nr:hypothetical protein [Chitinophagaceae bacterium]